MTLENNLIATPVRKLKDIKKARKALYKSFVKLAEMIHMDYDLMQSETEHMQSKTDKWKAERRSEKKELKAVKKAAKALRKEEKVEAKAQTKVLKDTGDESDGKGGKSKAKKK